MQNTIAERIKAIRAAAGDTAAGVGKRIGVSRQAVDKWERGDTENMKLGNLIRFCDTYHVNIEALIRGEGYLWAIGNEPRPHASCELRASEHGPDEYHLAPDERRLIKGFREADETIRRVLLRIITDT